jgi:hypothetical protein
MSQLSSAGGYRRSTILLPMMRAHGCHVDLIFWCL